MATQNTGMFLYETAAKFFLIYPFLFILGLFDFIISLVVPGKYKDPKLPHKNTILSRLTDKRDPTSSYKSVQQCEFIVEDDENLYSEFVKSVNKFANFNTLGVR